MHGHGYETDDLRSALGGPDSHVVVGEYRGDSVHAAVDKASHPMVASRVFTATGLG